MENVICRLWGHDEVDDQQYPVTWCGRCGESMTEYGHLNEDLSDSLYISRPFILIKNTIIYKIERIKDKLMRRIYGDDYDIPF